MAWLLSTGLKEKLKAQGVTGVHAVAAATISFGDGDGTGGRDTIADSGSGLGGFTAGDTIMVYGGANDGISAEILTVAAGTLEVAAGTFTTQAAGSQYIIATARGGSVIDVFRNMTVKLWSGSRPSSADLAEVGTKLVDITLNSGAFTPGSPTNGLSLRDTGSLSLGRAYIPGTTTEQTWSGLPVATGQANSIWIYDNAAVEGASSSSVRMVGRVAQTGSDIECVMSTGTTVTTGVTVSGVTVSITI